MFQFRLRGPELRRTYLSAFPAVHFSPPAWYDYVLRFSGEITVLSLTALVLGLNVYYFDLPGKPFADSSHAAQLLLQHPEQNPKRYQKLASRSTVVFGKSGFVSLASAEDLPEDTGDDEQDPESSIVISDGAVVKPSPDSVSGLIAKQVKIYETKEGDTLSSVSKEFGISIQTIAGANKLTTSSNLRPGWQLLISPVDGAVYKATSNDTIPDVAKRFSVSQETVISYNALENAEDIEPGQVFIIPGGVYPQPKPKVAAVVNKTAAQKAKDKRDGKVNSVGVKSPRNVDNGTGHTFPWGYCTWYVATRVHVPWGGNAKNWLANARSYGAVITSEPVVGSIVVTSDNKRYGHVAYVESVDDSGFTVSEMNYKKFGSVNTRWISRGSSIVKGFIQP